MGIDKAMKTLRGRSLGFLCPSPLGRYMSPLAALSFFYNFCAASYPHAAEGFRLPTTFTQKKGGEPALERSLFGIRLGTQKFVGDKAGSKILGYAWIRLGRPTNFRHTPGYTKTFLGISLNRMTAPDAAPYAERNAPTDGGGISYLHSCTLPG